MDMVILNTSRLRVAVNRFAKENNENSMTALFKRNGMNSSVLAKAETRFSTYADKVNFEIEEYTSYGAMYDDMWQQIVSAFKLKKEDFELERISVAVNGKSNCKELELKVSDLEEKVIHLMKGVEEMRMKGE